MYMRLVYIKGSNQLIYTFEFHAEVGYFLFIYFTFLFLKLSRAGLSFYRSSKLPIDIHW